MVLVSYILYNYISILQTKFSYGEGYEARGVGLEAMPLDEHIEGRHSEGEACLERRPDSVHDLLEMKHHRQHGEHRRRGQEDLRPVLMGLQETKEPRPLGEAGEQRPIVARQPAIEGTIPDTFERMQQSQGHHLTGPEAGLGMFGEA